MLLETLRGDGERPWRSGELGFVPVERVDALDGGAVLAGLWPNLSDDGDGDLRTGPWPGTAEAVEIQDDPDAVAAETALLLGDAQEWLLGLVPAARGADAPALCGWSGPVNYTETAELCAVLRDWEDRLGARVITVGFDTLGVSVAAPPADAERARAVAVEHYAFCADVIDQGMEPDAYVASLVGRPFWSFWWD
ncbi:DUF4253 domain-containing protein [Actinomadura flavalba]|uniref:DUF4253 domain-containing protein n=1 Tax=Actinomadura flavalba TaxID=1120938 RepID=UPI0003771FD7|nr:DUF4253 domain-containing protein [Actinomadura flavalba]